MLISLLYFITSFFQRRSMIIKLLTFKGRTKYFFLDLIMNLGGREWTVPDLSCRSSKLSIHLSGAYPSEFCHIDELDVRTDDEYLRVMSGRYPPNDYGFWFCSQNPRTNCQDDGIAVLLLA